jgi:hypothetical protein
MNSLAKGGVSNEEVAGMQQGLQSSLMEQLMPAFSAMMDMGQQQMGDNPMMAMFGGSGGNDSLGFRDRLKMFSHLYGGGDKDEFMAEQRMAQPGGVPIADAMQMPQQPPQQPQQGQQAPQMNFNPQMGNLTPEQRAGLFGPQFGGFGGR